MSTFFNSSTQKNYFPLSLANEMCAAIHQSTAKYRGKVNSSIAMEPLTSQVNSMAILTRKTWHSLVCLWHRSCRATWHYCMTEPTHKHKEQENKKITLHSLEARTNLTLYNKNKQGHWQNVIFVFFVFLCVRMPASSCKYQLHHERT